MRDIYNDTSFSDEKYEDIFKLNEVKFCGHNYFDRLSEKSFYTSEDGLHCPKYEIISAELKGLNVKVEIHMKEDDFDNFVIETTLDKMKLLPHDLICSYLLDKKMFSEDLGLKEVFPGWILGSNSDDYSPDISKYSAERNELLIGEIGTQYRGITNYYKVKKMKYDVAAKLRKENDVIDSYEVYVTIVSSDQIVTDKKLTDDESKTVMQLYILGQSINSTLSSEYGSEWLTLNPIIEKDGQTLITQIVKTSELFDKLLEDKVGDDDYLITDEMIKSWESEPIKTKEIFTEFKNEVLENLVKVASIKQNTSPDDEINDFNKLIDKHYLKEWTRGEEKVELRSEFKSALKMVPFRLSKQESLNELTDNRENFMCKLFSEAANEKGDPEFILTKEEMYRMQRMGFTGLNKAYEGERRDIQDTGFFEGYEEDANEIEEDEFDAENHRKDLSDMSVTQFKEKTFIMRFFTEEDREKLAERGIQSKKYNKTDIRMINKAFRDTIPYDYFKVNTDFINEFIRDDDTVLAIDLIDSFPFWSERMENIYQDAYGNNKYADKIKEEFKWFGKTRLGKMSQSYDEVWTELCISANQHCKMDEFVYKSIKGTNVKMLYKVVNASSSLHFALKIPKADVYVDLMKKHLGMFIDIIDYNDDYYVTNFYSIDRHRLSHEVFSTEFLSTLLPLFNDIMFSGKEISKEVRRTIIGQSLINFNSKAATTEISLNSRFMYMILCSQGKKSVKKLEGQL